MSWITVTFSLVQDANLKCPCHKTVTDWQNEPRVLEFSYVFTLLVILMDVFFAFVQGPVLARKCVCLCGFSYVMHRRATVGPRRPKTEIWPLKFESLILCCIEQSDIHENQPSGFLFVGTNQLNRCLQLLLACSHVLVAFSRMCFK